MRILTDIKEELTEEPKETMLSLALLDKEKRPFVLICPGGGYTHLAIEKEGISIQNWLHSLGYHTGILSYQVKDINPNLFLEDLNDVMTYLKQEQLISKIFVMGFSAGGHVAGLIGTKATVKPDGLLLCYPVVSFLEAFSHHGSCEHFLGKYGSEQDKLKFSIEKNVDSNTPPCFIWHTAEDTSVSMANSLALANALNQQKVAVELHIFPEGRHGLGILPDVPHTLQWKRLAENWIINMTKERGK